jgi:DNA mismatch repair protein MutL
VTIRRLSPAVADAIAAGEVVERPASVVKELVENALDAGARSVEIELAGAGQERVTVTDDGGGIAAAELALAVTRHATSKLEKVQDLAAVGTLGFRGEALASIAAVSRLELRSCTGDGTGAMVRAEHGEVGSSGAAPPVPGTRVEVRGLFENTPARRAFLKRPATETAAAVRVVAALALCHPKVAFRVSADGRRVLDAPGDGDLGRTFRGLHRGVGALLHVDGARGAARVAGVLGEPADCRRSRDHLYLAVNGRPVANRTLAFAVEQAFRGLVEPGRFPVGTLDIELPAELVDVNVHPTKREVRFREDRLLFGLVQEACLAALSQSSAYAGAALFAGGRGEIVAELGGGAVVAEATPPQYANAAGFGAVATSAAAVRQLPLAAETAPDDLAAVELKRGPFRLIGQVMDSYIVAEGPDGLVLVDQHAAHERVLFNQLQAVREAGGARQVQPMLVPSLLHLTPVQAAYLADARDDLAAAGIVVEEFGADAARLVAHDPRLPASGLDRIALDVLDSLISESKELDHVRRLERTTYTVACHAAIRFGQRLSREEMEGLLRQLEVADPGITCPHGRPTLLEISEGQLRREFRRS